MLTQIINARILTPQGWLKDGSVLIRDNKILEVTNCDLAIIGAKLIDAKGMYIVPGGVEIHVHGGGGQGIVQLCRGGFRKGDVVVLQQQRFGLPKQFLGVHHVALSFIFVD